MSFVERHGLWTAAQQAAAVEVQQRVEREGLELVRLSFPDLHGILRGKALLPGALSAAMRNGCAITSTLLLKDTSHRTVTSVFSPGAGVGRADLQGGPTSSWCRIPRPSAFCRG